MHFLEPGTYYKIVFTVNRNGKEYKTGPGVFYSDKAQAEKRLSTVIKKHPAAEIVTVQITKESNHETQSH